MRLADTSTGMKAIFIGGPLHGQIKQVESNHNHVAWVPPRSAEEDSIVVRYQRRFAFEDTGIFCVLDADWEKQVVEAIQSGLQLAPQPSVRETIQLLFQMNAGYAFFSRDGTEERKKERL